MKTCYVFLVWVLLVVVVFFSGCKSKGKQPAKDANSVEPNIPKSVSTNIEKPAIPESKVLATVNGTDITEEQLEQQFEKEASPVDKQMPPKFFEQYRKEMREKLLGKMVINIILDGKVKENNITVTDDEIAAYIDNMAAGLGMPVQEYKEMLKAQGRDFDEYKEELRRQIGHEKFFQSQLGGSVNVTEEEVKQYYSQNPDKFKRNGRIAPFEEVKNEVQQMLLKDKRKQILSQYVEKLKTQANIVYPGSKK